MTVLKLEYITDLYCLIDNLIPLKLVNKSLGGRPLSLTSSELITLLVWNTLTVKSKTLKEIHSWTTLYHKKDFPRLPKYSAFVNLCHTNGDQMLSILKSILVSDSPLVFADSTMLQVCKLIRADRHKVAVNIAKLGKNWQGWHFGFKLHLGVNMRRQITGFCLTPANVYDAQKIPNLINLHTKVLVGDSHYGASVIGRKINQKFGTIIIAPPHFMQKKKILTPWQHKLLTLRPKIESVFDYLKEHLHLVTSFPRSVNGYTIHYLRILLSYQIMHI